MESDLIYRSAAIEALLNQPNTPTPSVIRRVLRQVPGVDAVIRPVVEQIQWERDCAIEQLKDHGIPFGGKAPDVVKVVRCKDCKHFTTDCGVTYCDYHTSHACDYDGYCDGVCDVCEDDFCSYGERREENEEG